jgi:2'-5' RNA ligase
MKGVPAHITLLFPFLDPPSIDDEALARLESIFEGANAFPFSLDAVRRFPQGVLWLSPTPSAPFVDLTVRIAAAFPSCPPWAGEYDEIIPHLTIGLTKGIEADAIDAELQPKLPISSAATRVDLMTEEASGEWTVRRSFHLQPVSNGAAE